MDGGQGELQVGCYNELNLFDAVKIDALDG